MGGPAAGLHGADRKCRRTKNARQERSGGARIPARCHRQDGWGTCGADGGSIMNPLTGIYGAATALRNRLFDRGVLSSRRLEQPVVSIGNLSVGGSGKTPFVIAIGELLKARGIRFDVLTRGDWRKSPGVLIVAPGGNPADFGDTPLLIWPRLGVPGLFG